MSARPPFVVMGTPRSRTAWLAQFLSPPGTMCEHEPTVRWQGISDLWAFLERGDHGASDATLTWFWRDILAFRPDTRIVVVRRPIREVRLSCRRAGIPLDDPDGLEELETEAIEAATPRVRGFPVLAVTFAGLADPDIARAVFVHCLGIDPPIGWIEAYGARKIEAPWRERFAEGMANLPGFQRLLAERGQLPPSSGARW